LYATILNTRSQGQEALERQIDEVAKDLPPWIVMYGVDDLPLAAVMDLIRARSPRTQVLGATSFQGVFTAKGFVRETCLLVGERADGVELSVSMQTVGASAARESAEASCRDIARELGARPTMLLLHATPGFEERILEGVKAAFGATVPVFGGSAADDSLTGRWRVHANGASSQEGFLLAGLSSPRDVRGGFMGGFLPTEHTGTITKVDGRVVHEIDGRPAAEVYDAWTGGAIAAELGRGGNVLSKTNMRPLSRCVGSALGMPRRILSHPHEVVAGTNALTFFTEFSRSDRLTLMTSTSDPLVTRVRRAVERARGSQTVQPRGGLLVYCGGSLSAMLDKADTICREFEHATGGAPFLGIATFGEQGAFFAGAGSWHGNLMCSAVLF